ncbi:MAG TPA: IMP cyclohydrolase, partial [Clostridia bacterium]|nr:IMP cyclohydrolase [Clostridia bacterium]
MESRDIASLFAANAYPGRGIALGLCPDGKTAALAYFIMGRSANSRNRAFVRKGADLGIRVLDEQKLSDPSLILYAPVRTLPGATVVTNGDQTDTVREALLSGGTFEQALRTRRFEPDAPHYT